MVTKSKSTEPCYYWSQFVH